MPLLGQAWVEISASTVGLDEGLGKAKANLTNAVTGMSGEFGRLETAMGRAGEALTRAFKYVVIYEGLREVGSKIRELIGLGMEFNKTMETSRISLASSFMNNMNFFDQFGHAVSDVQALNAALGMSSKMIERIRYDNLQTTATFQDMTKVFTASLPAGLHLGMSANQVEQITVRMMQVAGAQGWDMSSMGAQLRELLRGQVRATSPLSSIFSLEDIKKARGDAQAMYDLIMKSTQAFALTGKMTQNTFTGIYSNLKSVFSEAAGRGLMDSFYDPLKDLMSKWMTNIATVNEQTHQIDFNPEFVAKFESIGRLAMSVVNAFSQIAESGLDIASTLGDWSDAVSAFGDGITASLGIIGDMLKDLTDVKDQLVEIAKLSPAITGGVPHAGAAGLLGALAAGATGKIPFLGALSWGAGAGAGLGLGAGYEAMRANQKQVKPQNTMEATVGLAGAGALIGATAVGPVSMGTLTVPGAAVGALIGAMTALTGAIIAQTNQHEKKLQTSATGKLPAFSPAAAWTETAHGAPAGTSALYGRQWESALKNLTPEIEGDIKKYSNKFSIPSRLLRAILGAESGFRQTDQYGNTLESKTGALGIGQIEPSTARTQLGSIDPHDLEQNIKGSALYLSQLLQKFNGDMTKAIAAYNAGPGAVAKAGGVPAIPETQNYVSRVGGYMQLEGMEGPSIHATPKTSYKQLPEGQMDTMFSGIKDKANALSKMMADQMQSYFATFAQNSGQAFEAQADQIQKRMDDLTTNGWKQIENAQKSFLGDQKRLEKQGISPDAVHGLVAAMGALGQKGLPQAEAELTKKQNMAPGDVKKLESSVSALFQTWTNGLQLVNFLQTNVSSQLMKQAELSDTLRGKLSMAQLNERQAQMSGTYKDQIDAQIRLIQAQEQSAELRKPPGQVSAMRQVAGAQVSDLEMQRNGSVFQNLMGMFSDQMRNMNTNLNLATGLFQSFNQSLDMVSTTVWQMISNFQHMDTFAGGEELRRRLQQLGFNIANMFGEALTKNLMQKYIEQPLFNLFGIGGDTGASGSLTGLAAAAQAAAQALWSVSGSSGPAGILGSSSSSSGIMGFLSNLPFIGGLFGGGAAMSAAMAATPFAAMAASDAASAAAPITLDSAMTFAQGLSAYANGGITSGPSLVGEAGEEAVIPLNGGRSVPVSLKGGGGASITIHAPITVKHQGEDQQAARAQGREISYALTALVKEQIHKELRPGGILNGTIRSSKP